MNYKIKLLIGDVDDSLIEIYVNRAVLSIKRYMNNDRFDEEYIKSNFEDAIIAIVQDSHDSKNDRNIKSFSEGSQSVTYSDSFGSTITNNVRLLLPTPYVRLM